MFEIVILTFLNFFYIDILGEHGSGLSLTQNFNHFIFLSEIQSDQEPKYVG